MASFPNMKSAVMHWAVETKVFVVCKSIVDYEVKESIVNYSVKLFRVPTGQDLAMKSEGQRAWNSETIYADSSLDIGIDDIIIFDCVNAKRYRVISKTDYAQFGFIEYSVLSDYSKGST